MEDFQINLFAFLGVLEFAIGLLAVALFFVVRSKRLAGRVRALHKKLKEAEQQEPETIGFMQHLRDEVIRNQDFIDRAAASEDDAEKKAGELLQWRKQFLELEVEACALEKNPVEFQDRLAAGMSELIEQLRPEAETVTETVSEATDSTPQADGAAEAGIEEGDEKRTTIDTHDAQVNRLKDVIINQHDAMVALRKELEAREGDIEDLDSILQKLDEFERQSSEAAREQSEPAIEPTSGEEETAEDEVSMDEEKRELEIKVQELEALVEFKDATVEELEKQYNILESKYLALTGEKSTG